jgi:hypothetical protein
VWPENRATLELFLSLRWDTCPMSGRVLGYHYPQLDTTLRLRVRAREREAMLRDLQVMERAALGELNRARRPGSGG